MTEFRCTDIRATAHRLVPEASGRIEEAAVRLAREYADHSLHDTDLLHAVEIAAAALPSTLRKELIAFRDRGNDAGALLLTGLPVGPLPPTPDVVEKEPSWTEVPVATLSQLMVMSVLGRSLSYSDEKSGRLVQDVCPKRGAAERQENSGSVLLELHTEDGFHPHPPHFLSLICLRGDEDGRAATVTAGIRDVLPLLDAETVRVLREAEFRTRFSTSFVSDPSVEVLTDPMPVLTGPCASPELRVDFHGTIALTPRAQEALDRLEAAMRRTLKGIVLRPGDLIVVDNRRAVHGRTGFEPRYDGTDRWLRRSFAVSDLRPLDEQFSWGRSHRPVDTAHLRRLAPATATL
ncbi:TauD/TfdA family dioxygenase [Streptomyces sp. NPDC047046]|uniref:TauD/TfdA family dioxygenase n=1 Tax=Streptomyces sp. NPDC047046 TaxID=3155378 RepID=UPI0033D017AF